VSAHRKTLMLAIAALVLAVAATTGVTLGAFSSPTSNAGNSFTAAATFCPSTGSQTVTASEDSNTQEDNANSNHGSNNSLWVKSDNGKVRRVFVKFPLPAIPGGCTVTSAVLRLYVRTGPQARTLAVYRPDADWTEATITWNNQPAAAGTAVTTNYTAPGWVQWTVTNHVTALYAGSNFGLTVQDANEGVGTDQEDINSTEAGSNHPELTVTWA
jgi:hypothetical protein